MGGWTWNSCRASRRRLVRGLRALQRVHSDPVALQETPNVLSVAFPIHVMYANILRSTASILPQGIGGQVIAELSEQPQGFRNYLKLSGGAEVIEITKAWELQNP